MSHINTFRALHSSGTFVLPNPWDRGSAKTLQDLGFQALATTSAGFAQSIGKDDQEVTREELIGHVADLTAFIDLPLNVDSERLFPEDPGGIAETVAYLAEAGAAGISIEDFDPASDRIDDLAVAVNAVAEAAEACSTYGIVLTARAENHLYGIKNFEDTLARLAAYKGAGADVLYAPGLTSPSDISQVVGLGLPVNVLAFPDGPSLPQLTALGVRRVSVGSALYNAAADTVRDAAQHLLGSRTANDSP
jgi:2-methylisocitrate lyase-like PEP mutase family enzyme